MSTPGERVDQPGPALDGAAADEGVPVLELALRVERDIFLVRQRGREVAAAVGLEHQDQVRVATALSEIARELLAAAGGADVVFTVSPLPPHRLVVALTSAGVPAGDEVGDAPAAAVGRLMDEITVTRGPDRVIVRMTRRLPATAPPTRQRLARLRSELSTLAAATPLEELAVQNQQLLTALDEVRHQRDELAQLNAELEETNRGVLALYTQLSGELEETNRGVVALYAELDDKTAQLHAASEAKSRFLANVSHELRAPVTAVIGLGRMLADTSSDPLTAEQARQIELIRSSAADLLTLVNDLLNLAKAESGKLEPTWAPVDLRALFAQLRGTLRPLAGDRDVELVVEEPPGDVPLHSDEVLLAQVLRNLLTNALKFTERGEVRLCAVPSDGGGRIELTVTDTGIGIPAELHKRIFEEFYQVPGRAQSGVTGTGLGLPYARRVTELLGGSLTMDSASGQGSVFTMALPLAPPGHTRHPTTRSGDHER